MVHPLYYVLDLIFVFILVGMLFNELRDKHDKQKHEKAYMTLLIWVLFFCLQDAFWGFSASGFFQSDIPLVIASAVFHISTVATTFFWLYYILTFMWNRIRMALCASYTKILKINITDDTYKIIQMNIAEQTAEKGFADKIFSWLYNFGKSGQVHPEDLVNYLKLTDKDYMNCFFEKDKRNLNIFYRRKSSDGYRMTKMEMIPAEDYRRDNKNLYLYVKDIDE